MMIHFVVKLIICRLSSGNSCQLSSFYLENLNTYIGHYIKCVTCCFMCETLSLCGKGIACECTEENVLTLFWEVTRGLRFLCSNDIISTFYLLLFVLSHFVGRAVE